MGGELWAGRGRGQTGASMRVTGNQLGGGVNRPITSITEFTLALASMVDGTAFVYSDVDLSSYADVYKLILTDSAGKKATGFTGSVGGGLALGDDILDGLDLTSGWTPTDASISDSDTFVSSANNGRVFKNVGLGNNVVHQIVADVDASSGTWDIYVYSNTPEYGTPSIVTEDGTFYFAADANMDGIIRVRAAQSGVTVDINTLTIKQVTEPPATGLLIVSTRGGSTRNWANIESGFDPNDIAEIELEG